MVRCKSYPDWLLPASLSLFWECPCSISGLTGYLGSGINMTQAALDLGCETNLFVQVTSEKIKAMLDKAVEFMTATKDPSHGMDHIRNLLQEANTFFRSNGDGLDIDREVLLLALYWHDVWKSQHKPTRGNYLFQQLYEGLGSMFMFRNYARLAGLSPKLIAPVSYAIRKHSAVQRLPAKTLEAQLLWDVDTLDIWNSERVQSVFRNMRWTSIPFFDSYILYMKKVGVHLNFEWSRDELKRVRPLFFEEMSRFRENLMRGKRA